MRVHGGSAQGTPRAAVLLLHGGRADALTPPPFPNLPALRMVPFATAIGRATRGDGVVVGTVRYRHRGWNGSRDDAARDAERALVELARTAGPVPVVLVGHSMGARAALRVAGHPRVRGVVALAPWCPPGEPVAHLSGKRLYLLHDEADRITDARATWAFADRATAAGAEARRIVMPRGGHGMLRGARLWHRTVTDLAAGLLER
ncbi:alpha/beta hydrolase [Streptomyces sp. NPDC047928]|uniref:alpha/beta hydrolase n=1 Tax=unclassified Streptomyces TaxID=2593676 RepID=UPI0037153DDF